MNRGTTGICVLVGVAVIGVVVLGGMAAGTASATEGAQNTSLGADISSFMQASSAEATDEVEEGTFEAALNRTEDDAERRALIEARQERLQERSEQLRARHEELGNASDIRNRSIATWISVGAAGLERSANRTGAVAAQNGINTEQLDEVRSNARTLRGPEVAELARSIGGPPGGEPPGRNQTGPPGANQTGPPDDRTPGPSEPRGDADGDLDARDAERGSPATDPGANPAANGSNSTDRPAESGAQGNSSSAHDQRGGSGNSPDSSGAASDGTPEVREDDRRPPDAADNTSSAPPNDRSR